MPSDTGPFYTSVLNRLLDQRSAIPGNRRTWILAPFRRMITSTSMASGMTVWQ